MGRIVGGFATSHVLMAPDGVEAEAERVFAGMKEIGRRVRSLAPDVIVIVSSDHLVNFKLELQAPFIVGVSDGYVPFGDVDISPTPIAGHRPFAEGFIAAAAVRGFDLAKAEQVRPDHGVTIPNAIVNTGNRIPVVPLYINASMTPAPSPSRAWRLGNALRRYVDTGRPPAERVVVLATGGLSHWICLEDQGRVNQEFDRKVIDMLAKGKGDGLARLSAEELLAQAGNGGMEILNWICMAGALPGSRGEPIYYEPMPAWLTGMGGVALNERGAS